MVNNPCLLENLVLIRKWPCGQAKQFIVNSILFRVESHVQFAKASKQVLKLVNQNVTFPEYLKLGKFLRVTAWYSTVK